MAYMDKHGRSETSARTRTKAGLVGPAFVINHQLEFSPQDDWQALRFSMSPLLAELHGSAQERF